MPPPRDDRRLKRFVVPETCERTCGTRGAVSVVDRTAYVLYLRCAACGAVWSVPKPGGLPLEPAAR